MDKLKMHTPNKADENFKKLAAMFPNAVTETINENGEVVRAIDKDVLCPEEAATTWSQGDMTLEEMLKVLLVLCSHFEKENGKILQVDICGECDPDKSMESPKNDHANKELLRFWKKWF